MTGRVTVFSGAEAGLSRTAVIRVSIVVSDVLALGMPLDYNVNTLYVQQLLHAKISKEMQVTKNTILHDTNHLQNCFNDKRVQFNKRKNSTSTCNNIKTCVLFSLYICYLRIQDL